VQSLSGSGALGIYVVQCVKNYSLQLVLHLHTLRGDLNNWIKTVDYNQYRIGIRLSLDAFTTLQEQLEL
jgi:hypothetical protein